MNKGILILLVGVCMIGALAYARPEPEDKKDTGGFVVDVNNERGEGTRVDARGRQEVWRSDDGKSRAEVYGHWDRTYGGSNDGQRSHGYGGRFEHSWGR
uniref:Venom glycine-rich peptide Pp24a n=1 Tax=Pristhesancus plagipennis TaxID=1955184 RepID=A0A2K8JW95_PRIPG|nr:venom glycine-rich peptide Pp24a [Pristhesancus plagipennis]